MKKKFTNSVSFKLNIVIAIALIVIFTTLTIYTSYHSYHDAIAISKKIVEKEAKEFGSEVEKDFAEIHSSVLVLHKLVNNHLNIPRSKRSREQIANNLKVILESNSNILVAGVYFEPNAFDGDDAKFKGKKYGNSNGRFAIISYKDGNGIGEATSDNVDNPEKNSFYTDAIKKEKLFISEPAFDELNGKEILAINYTIPIKEGNKTVGIVLCAISLDELQTKITEFKGEFDKTYFILNSTAGSMVAHGTKITNRMKNIIDLHNDWKVYFDKAQNNQSSDVTAFSKTMKQDNVYTFSPVELKGSDKKWVVQSATQLQNFVAGAKKAMYINIATYIAVLLIVIIFITILVRKLISVPLESIRSATLKIANYNLDTSDEREKLAKQLNSKDEIGEISRSTKLMVENLREMVKNITAHASNTAATAQQLTATAQSTNESAREVAHAVGNIAEGASGQAHDTTKAAQNIEENSKSMDEMIVQLKELESITREIDSKKDEGKDALINLIKNSEENKRAAGFVNKIILETNESAEDISNASDMIQSIADQTNLLALNAAIELAVGM